ncbi:hypothetical protein ABPG75_005913 [Micractinium tetrahymenae]
MAGLAPSEQRRALLGGSEAAGGDAEAGGWAAVPPQPPREGPSVAELVRSSPDAVISTLQRNGVQLVAEFSLPDKLVLGRLGEDRIATMGAQQAQLPNYEAAWRSELGPCRRRRAPGAGKEPQWCSEIPVQAYVVSVRDAAAPGAAGLLRPLIRRWQAGGCGTAAFQLPVVQAVVDWKWHFCRQFLIAELGLYILWLASFFVFALAQQTCDRGQPPPPPLGSPRGRLAAAAGLAGAVALYLGRLPAAPRILPVACAVQCILLLLRLQFYSRVFPATRFAFVDDLKEVMRWYLAFLVLLMAGYAAAFIVLFAPDVAAGRGRREFGSLGRSFITMVSWVAGDPNLTLLYDGTAHPVAASVLGLSYVFSLTLVLMTLLISLMTNTLQKVTRDAEARQQLSKALIIDELESTVPRLLHWLWPGMHPRFIHALRIDPTRLDAVRLDRLWKSLSDDDADALQGGSRAVPAGPQPAAAPPAAATPQPQPQPLPKPPQPALQAQQPSQRLTSGSAAHTRQPSQPPPGSAAGLSTRSSLPGEAPPSIHWQGSLMDAYLGALGQQHGSPSEGDALHDFLPLGGLGADADPAAALAGQGSASGYSRRPAAMGMFDHLKLPPPPEDRSLAGWFEWKFRIKQRGSSVGREVRAGFILFLVSVFSVLLNPVILSGAASGYNTGMPKTDVALATAISSGAGTLTMGLVGNYPWVLGVQLGTNNYFVDSVLQQEVCGANAFFTPSDDICANQPCSCSTGADGQQIVDQIGTAENPGESPSQSSLSQAMGLQPCWERRSLPPRGKPRQPAWKVQASALACRCATMSKRNPPRYACALCWSQAPASAPRMSAWAPRSPTRTRWPPPSWRASSSSSSASPACAPSCCGACPAPSSSPAPAASASSSCL